MTYSYVADHLDKKNFMQCFVICFHIFSPLLMDDASYICCIFVSQREDLALVCFFWENLEIKSVDEGSLIRNVN